MRGKKKKGGKSMEEISVCLPPLASVAAITAKDSQLASIEHS